MALIDLPGHTVEDPSQWDDTKKLHQQTDNAQVYVSGVTKDYAKSAEQTEECVVVTEGVGSRPTEWLHVDTENNFEVKICPLYHYSTTHKLHNSTKEFCYFVRNLNV